MRSIFLTTASSALALLLAAPHLSAPAAAGEIEAASKIDAVTVYPDAAIVTRLVEVDMPKATACWRSRTFPWGWTRLPSGLKARAPRK
jgi:hypothetical protein